MSNVLGFAGAFPARADFIARWQVRSWTGEGKVVWLVENFEWNATIGGGRQCNIATCEEWFYSTKALFYNAAGTQVASVSLSALVPDGRCGVWGPSAHGQTDLVFDKCKKSFEVPYSATKVKITWTVSVTNGVGVSWPGWTATTAKVNLT